LKHNKEKAAIRSNSRASSELRPVKMTPGYTKYAEGSVLIEVGETRVVCTATIEDRIPAFLKGRGVGWVTAEYAMLPRATETRMQREIGRGGPSGRTQEIQRLIGRSLRSIIDMSAIGERTVTIDCDVIQADGGTRTASITGGFVALALALNKYMEEGKLERSMLRDYVAAVSVGIVGGTVLLDLDYGEDSAADVDMNIVRTGDGRFVEIQGTAETEAFTRAQMDEMTAAAGCGIDSLIAIQRETIVQALNGKNLRVMIDPSSSGRINWKENAS
jgi:ribonuclease PH